jgi:hypothetical protein
MQGDGTRRGRRGAWIALLIVAGALLQAAPVGAASTIPAYDKADAMAVQTTGRW